MNIEALYRRSVEIIIANQGAAGGYVASPSFPTYNYCWFRDGAYIAYAMDRAGEYESSARFHDWAAENILRREEALIEAVRLVDEGRPIPDSLHLHTRYTLDGGEGEVFWENFQLDGLGTWLWALAEHSREKTDGKIVPANQRRAAELLVDYLSRVWDYSCYDLWEENREEHHIYTMASIFGGLKQAGDLLDLDTTAVCGLIEERIRERGCEAGTLVKYEGSSIVDASLLGAAVPAELFTPEDPVMKKTAERIEAELHSGGGVHRYLGDTYYGGGIWLLLRGWLGLYRLAAGDRRSAVEALNWMAEQAGPEGELPEQIDTRLLAPDRKEEWVRRWGPSASPLLWSHAVFIWLYKELKG